MPQKNDTVTVRLKDEEAEVLQGYWLGVGRKGDKRTAEELEGDRRIAFRRLAYLDKRIGSCLTTQTDNGLTFPEQDWGWKRS